MNINAWENVLEKGLSESAFPCYAAAVGRGNDVFFKKTGGKRACFPEPLPLTDDTLFDMASLSKLIGTTMAALRMIERKELHLDDKLDKFFESCHGKENITIRHLMTHTSGIASFFNMWKMGISPDDAHSVILSYPLAAPTGTRVIYSCMGYILLGKILERICASSLDDIVRKEVTAPLEMDRTVYCPTSNSCCVTTEKKINSDGYICGRVHDENADFLGGVSGNAGLFAPFDDVIKFAKMLSFRGKGYLKQETFDMAVTDLTCKIPGGARGLGFQLYRSEAFPAGSKMSPGSYGHTGFTGTSLYVDNDTGVYCILLTNRVHFGRDTEAFFKYRTLFYDTVFSDIRECLK